MVYTFNKSAQGYSHKKDKKECQDYSLSYKDVERIIIATSDGHGGKAYIRSELGSKFSCLSVLNVLKDITSYQLFHNKDNELENKIRLSTLCEWNRLVENDISKHRISKSEMSELSEEEIDELLANCSRAYGATLTGAMLYRNKIIVIGIGDTECIGIKDGHIFKIFDTSDDPAGNITYSMCQSDAYTYLRVKILEAKQVDGVFLCSDGLTSPYQSYLNFEQSFLRPLVYKTLDTHSIIHVEPFIDSIANSLGVGDDVSLSFLLFGRTRKHLYK